MNEFFIDCLVFKQYSMVLNLTLWSRAMPFWSCAIQHSAGSWSLAMRHSAGSWSSAMRHSAGFTYKFYTKKVLHYAALRGINTFSLISQRIQNRIRKYFRVFICGLGVINWRKNQNLKILWHCPFKAKQAVSHVLLFLKRNKTACFACFVTNYYQIFSFIKKIIDEG
jgi:hypothetical protein